MLTDKTMARLAEDCGWMPLTIHNPPLEPATDYRDNNGNLMIDATGQLTDAGCCWPTAHSGDSDAGRPCRRVSEAMTLPHPLTTVCERPMTQPWQDQVATPYPADSARVSGDTTTTISGSIAGPVRTVF